MLSRRKFLLQAGAAGLLTALGNNVFAQDFSFIDTGYSEEGPKSNVIPTGSYTHPELYSGSTADVGLAIVCAIDISGSVDSDTGEYQAQLQSLANAIASDDMRESIFYPSGPQSIALCVVDYNDNSKLQIPWVDFRSDDRFKFLKFAEQVLSIKRRQEYGGTDHSSAMENAGYCFANMPFNAKNKAVNIMTDGTGAGMKTRQWNKILATEHEATVYALTTNTGRGNLNTWAHNNLKTPRDTYIKKDGTILPGGFVHEVATERQTQIKNKGSDPAAYNNAVLLAIRRQIIQQTAGLDILDPRQCHEFECRRYAKATDILVPTVV